MGLRSGIVFCVVVTVPRDMTWCMDFIMECYLSPHFSSQHGLYFSPTGANFPLLDRAVETG